MSDDATPRLALPFLAAGQAQKEMTHNEALQCLDAIVQPVALSADLTGPPASPEVGACWIVAAGATDSWAGRERCIAQWTTGGWRFAAPLHGWKCHVIDRGLSMTFDGSGWRNDPLRPDGVYLGGDKVLGARMDAIGLPVGGTMIDGEARMVIAEILHVLRGHGLISS